MNTEYSKKAHVVGMHNNVLFKTGKSTRILVLLLCCLFFCSLIGFSTNAYAFGWFGGKEEKVVVKKVDAAENPKEGASSEPEKGDGKSNPDEGAEEKEASGEVEATGEIEASGEGEGEDDGLLKFNLKNANIDQILKFIAEHTGKPVLKSKKVAPTITVSSSERITPQQALDLMYDALRLEGFIVLESEERIQIVPAEEVVQQDILAVTWPLDPEMLQRRARFIRCVIPLSAASATSLKAHIEPLLGKYASISADENTNKMIVTDTVRNIERYQKILNELDIVGFDQNDIRIIPLNNADASEIYNTVKKFVDDSFGKKKKSGGPPSSEPNQNSVKKEAATVVLPLPRTNSILVSAPPERLKTIVGLIKQLDQEKAKDVDIHVIDLKYATTRSVSNAVTRLFPKKKNQAEKEKVQVIDAGNSNSLIVVASNENMKIVRNVVKQIDTEKAQKKDTRRFKLKYLDAESTAEELGELYGSMKNDTNNYWNYWYSGRNRGDDDKMKFVPIVRTNSIIAIGPANDFTLVESLIEEIDKPFEKEEVLPKIYHIKFSEAKSVEKVLNTVFGSTKDSSSSGGWYNSYYGSNSRKKTAIGRLSGKVNFIADENTNSIVVTTNNKANYEIVDEVIKELDQAFPEMANTMIYPLKNADAIELAKELNSLFGTPVKEQAKKTDSTQEQVMEFYYGSNWGSRRRKDETPISNLIDRVRFVPDKRTNSLLVTTASYNFTIIKDLIDQLDKEEPQVLIKVRIIEVKENKTKKLGLRWTPDMSIVDSEELDNAVSILNNLSAFDDFYHGDGLIESGSNINLILQLLIKNLDAKIIIDPMLYMNNNEEGMIFAGSEIPRQTGQLSTDTGATSSSITFVPVGIKLQITPHINTEGVVEMKVHLKTDQITGETRFGSDILQSREYKTELAVHDGDTMVMGGIKLDSRQRVTRKTPIIGQIPLIGKLFQNHNRNAEMNNLYVFITPTIVTSKEQAANLSSRYEKEISIE